MTERGTYALVLHLAVPQQLTVGALGTFAFPAGWYVYLGSAHGPGGLKARVDRHCRRENKRVHWHIDYLRAVTTLVEVWTRSSKTRRECDWAAATAALPGGRIVAPRFGASDCRCPAHLVHFEKRPEPTRMEHRIKEKLDVERTIEGKLNL